MSGRSRAFTSNTVGVVHGCVLRFTLTSRVGPIIRVAPNEVHVNDLGFLDTIYAPATRRREKETPRNLDIGLSVAGSANHELHKKRREALNPFFSKKSVVSLGPMISEKIQELCKRLEECAKFQTPANLSDMYYALAMEYVCSHEDFHWQLLIFAQRCLPV